MRKIGDRYRCEKCGAELVYEKPCPCGPTMKHEEICCGRQMTVVGKMEQVKQPEHSLQA